MTWDETGGWIFSEDYHTWQESPTRRGAYRPGNASQVRNNGWYTGLFTIKDDGNAVGAVAQWPDPIARHNLDLIAPGMEGLTP